MLSLVVLLLNQLKLFYIMNVGVTVAVSICLLNFILTLIVFTRLSQGNALLQKQNLSPRKLTRFFAYHTATLSLIHQNDPFYGSNILVFILVSLAINTYLSILLLNGAFTLLPSAVFLHLIVFQLVVILGFHLLAAMYSTRIHTCATLLLGLSGNRKWTKGGRPITGQLVLANFIEAFHTKHKYGITYWGMGLISLTTFTKVQPGRGSL